MIFIAIFIGLLGFLPLAIVLFKRNKIRKLKANGTYVSGVVTNHYQTRGYKGVIYYHAVIQYPVRGGAPLVRNFKYAGHKNLLSTGQQVEVVYDNDNPEKFTLTILPENKAMLIFTAIIAVVYIFICFKLYETMKDAGL